ncbi:L,D-transpeptidase [Salipiger sp.]|uniref:L,D-transpeptidase n=1 Tax=Salipiger sp. TaxID=2078585 RepID=UPI003A983022
MTDTRMTRRGLIGAAGAALTLPLIPARARATVNRNNISSFVSQEWQDHFENVDVVTLVADTGSRALHYWSVGAADYRVYPTSVPKTDELTKRGYTEIVRKKVGPTWTPTASQMERFPDWHPVEGGAPDNPLGTHAMYLSWPAYIIHGTHDTRKIGRPSSDGCIGLYNEKIAELFELCPIGTQVRVI